MKSSLRISLQLEGIYEKMIFYFLGIRNLSIDPPFMFDFWFSKDSFLISSL